MFTLDALELPSSRRSRCRKGLHYLPVIAGTPNSSTITSYCSILLPNPNLRSLNLQATIFPGPIYRSLLLFVQFCNSRYDANFNKTKVVMSHLSTPTIISARERPSGMYLINLRHMTPADTNSCPLPHPTQLTACMTYELRPTLPLTFISVPGAPSSTHGPMPLTNPTLLHGRA